MAQPYSPSRVGDPAALQSRIRQMQGTSLDSRALPTYPGLGRLLPGGALQRGCSYQVSGSTTLSMAMLAGVSASGTWCAVMGVPSFNAEAASQLGIDLNKLILVPTPGEQWQVIAATLLGVVDALLVGELLGGLTPGRSAAKLGARLRQRGNILVTQGPWEQAEASLEVTQERWTGIGQGHGYLQQRRMSVQSCWRNGRIRRGELNLPSEQSLPSELNLPGELSLPSEHPSAPAAVNS